MLSVNYVKIAAPLSVNYVKNPVPVPEVML